MPCSHRTLLALTVALTAACGPEEAPAADSPQIRDIDAPFVADGLPITGRIAAYGGEAVRVVWSGEGGEVDTMVAADGTFELVVPGVGMVHTEPETFPRIVEVDVMTEPLTLAMAKPCPMTVQVVTPDGAPAAGVPFSVGTVVAGAISTTDQYLDAHRWLGDFTTNARGELLLDDMSCGLAVLDVKGPWLGERLHLDSRAAPQTVQLTAGTWMTGRVTDANGQPLGGAQCASDGIPGSFSETGADGQYTLLLPTDTPTAVYCTHPDHQGSILTFDEPAAQVTGPVPVALQPKRDVLLKCLGAPGEACAAELPTSCGSADITESLCLPSEVGELTWCACPEGDLVVGHGDQQVTVTGDDAVATFDYRELALVTGVVKVNGAISTDCTVSIGERRAGCDAQGRVTVMAVPTDSTEVIVSTPDFSRAVPLSLQAGLNDLKTLHMGGAARLEGVLVDAVTGEAIDGAALLLDSGEGGVSMRTHGRSGLFSFSGLPAGEYRLMADSTLTLPAEPIRLEEGERRHVEIRVQRGAEPVDLGLEAAPGAAGLPEVTAVQPGSTADRLGVRAGDRLVEVIIEHYGERITYGWPFAAPAGAAVVEMIAVRDGVLINLVPAEAE